MTLIRDDMLAEFNALMAICERAQRLDAEDELTDKDRKTTKDAWAEYNAKRKTFKEKLMLLVDK